MISDITATPQWIRKVGENKYDKVKRLMIDCDDAVDTRAKAPSI